jgi:hypothetical protein
VPFELEENDTSARGIKIKRNMRTHQLSIPRRLVTGEHPVASPSPFRALQQYVVCDAHVGAAGAARLCPSFSSSSQGVSV